MIEKRSFADLGGANHGWLNARHHFSFADYHDPRRMGWGRLRVWNDDEIASGAGFPPHPHSDMEIVTYVRDGAITHEDSMGNKGRTRAGDVQVMSAGSGIRHTEYNADPEVCRLFQIWIEPDSSGGAASWGMRRFPTADRSGRFAVFASGLAGDDDALPIRAAARVAGARLKAGETATYEAAVDRHLYAVAASGLVQVNGLDLGPRDAVAATGEPALTFKAVEDTDVVLVDTA